MIDFDKLPQLQESDLQIGDILIYEYPPFDPNRLAEIIEDPKIEGWYNKMMAYAWYLIHFAIPWCDPGKDRTHYKRFYHAAVWGNVDISRDTKSPDADFQNRIVEAGPGGTLQDSLDKSLKSRGVQNIYVCRYKDRDADFLYKINEQIRKFYNDTDLEYSYETAWLLSVMCSLRYKDGTLREMLEEHFSKETALVIVLMIRMLINHYQEKHQDKMIACSTLVAMIFYDTEKYEIQVDPFEANTPINIPPDFEMDLSQLMPMSIEKDEPYEKMEVGEVFVTPRQLFESSSVECIGYMHHRD